MEDIVATPRMETRRVAVRSSDWLGDWCAMLGFGMRRSHERLPLLTLNSAPAATPKATPIAVFCVIATINANPPNGEEAPAYEEPNGIVVSSVASPSRNYTSGPRAEGVAITTWVNRIV
jgi:hypothetical protein